jgi:hypothetical protein
MKITVFGRTLSLLEGPTDNVTTRAKAWNMRVIPDLMQDPTRTFQRLRGFRNIYLQGGYIAEAIDMFPIFALGGGFDLVIDEKIAKRVRTDGTTEKQEVKEFLDRINFFDIQWQLSVDAETVRDGVAEIVYGRGQKDDIPINVIPRPAESFDFVTDVQGRLLSYSQVRDNQGSTITTVSLPPASVLHYQFLSRPDSPYGISLVERTIHDINRDTKVAEAVAAGMILHGTPKFVTTVNAHRLDASPLTDTEWDEFEDSQEDFNAKDNFLYEGDVDMKVIDTTGVPNVQQYSDVTLFRVCAGTGVPAELLGLRQGTTDATAVSRIGAFLKKIKIVQRDIESLWNLNIIDKITGKPGLVKLKLTDASPEDFVQIAGAIAALRSGPNPEAVAPKEWARQRLNILTNEGLGIPDEEPPKQRPPDQIDLQDSGGSNDPEQDALAKLTQAAHALSEAIREV